GRRDHRRFRQFGCRTTQSNSGAGRRKDCRAGIASAREATLGRDDGRRSVGEAMRPPRKRPSPPLTTAGRATPPLAGVDGSPLLVRPHAAPLRCPDTAFYVLSKGEVAARRCVRSSVLKFIS